MKSGDKVFMATVQGVDEYYFVCRESGKARLTLDKEEAKQYCPSVSISKFRSRSFWVRASHVFSTYHEAVRLRIELLKKSIRTMETTSANHQRTIRRLQRKLRESKPLTTSEVSNGSSQKEKKGGPPVRNEDRTE